MIEDDIARAIRDELRLQRKAIEFDLDAVVHAVVDAIEPWGIAEFMDGEPVGAT